MELLKEVLGIITGVFIVIGLVCLIIDSRKIFLKYKAESKLENERLAKDLEKTRNN